jgi:hypothetical protein
MDIKYVIMSLLIIVFYFLLYRLSKPAKIKAGQKWKTSFSIDENQVFNKYVYVTSYDEKEKMVYFYSHTDDQKENQKLNRTNFLETYTLVD